MFLLLSLKGAIKCHRSVSSYGWVQRKCLIPKKIWRNSLKEDQAAQKTGQQSNCDGPRGTAKATWAAYHCCLQCQSISRFLVPSALRMWVGGKHRISIPFSLIHLWVIPSWLVPYKLLRDSGALLEPHFDLDATVIWPAGNICHSW